MKHAILIMAHGNFELLKHLVDYFNQDCHVFIHIDKKAEIDNETLLDLKSKSQVVNVYRNYNVHWGGFSILKCELFLLKEAVRLCDAQYFHLISGEDYPIKPFKEFNEFFEQRNGWEFVSYVHLPHKNFQNNTYGRFCHYLPYDLFKDRIAAQKSMPKIINWQRRLNIKRRIPDTFEHLYGGSQWFSITRQAVNSIIKYTNTYHTFYRRLRWTFAPEEVYIVTLVVNLMPKCSVINDNLRMIRWVYENGNFPANLSTEHFHLLVESQSFFVRKINERTSLPLIDMIDKYLLTDYNITDKLGWNGFRQNMYDKGIVEAIYRYCKMSNIEDGVDCGCGSGLYVAALRRLGLQFTGIDINPNVECYSKLLLPTGDQPCIHTDMTDEISSSEYFNLVICLDVFQYIPHNKVEIAIINMAKLTNNTIIVSWGDEFEKEYKKNKYENAFNKLEFYIDEFASSFVKRYSKIKQNIRVFRKGMERR